jgi:hypothetical protein
MTRVSRIAGAFVVTLALAPISTQRNLRPDVFIPKLEL